MDRALPDSHAGYEVRPGVVVRRWPAVYLTPLVGLGLRLHAMHRAGLRLLDAPVMRWPYPLVQAIERCDLERKIQEAARG